MPSPPLFTSWLVRCRSAKAARALKQRLTDRVRLDRLVEDSVRTYAGGVEKCQIEQHRLSDYFADIRILAASGNGATAFSLVFHRLANAPRFWKDLMVNIIGDVENSPETAAISLDYKGDENPVAAAEI